METLPILRRSLAGSWVVALAALLSAAATANELPARCGAPGLAIHGPEETRRDFCREEDGRLWLCLPDGARFELVTSTDDPSIANPGDGSFHPFEESVVRAALDEVRFPLTGVSVQIYLLPYPRRSGLESAAGDRLILLSPGVLPLSAEHQHAELVHELGHVVQYGFMPDPAVELWTRYRDLRLIADEGRYSPDASHADRPHEIFAEDFRALFGGGLANYSGSIENSSLCMPQVVGGLEDFLMSLAGVTLAARRIEAYPNPSAGPVRFRRAGGAGETLDLFDLAGRRLASLDAEAWAGQAAWRWDGLDRDGRRVPPGVVLARLRGTAEPALRLVIRR